MVWGFLGTMGGVVHVGNLWRWALDHAAADIHAAHMMLTLTLALGYVSSCMGARMGVRAWP